MVYWIFSLQNKKRKNTCKICGSFPRFCLHTCDGVNCNIFIIRVQNCPKFFYENEWNYCYCLLCLKPKARDYSSLTPLFQLWHFFNDGYWWNWDCIIWRRRCWCWGRKFCFSSVFSTKNSSWKPKHFFLEDKSDWNAHKTQSMVCFEADEFHVFINLWVSTTL